MEDFLRTILRLTSTGQQKEVVSAWNSRANAVRIAELERQNAELMKFVGECTTVDGGMVNGNRLSAKAKELVAALQAGKEPKE